MPAGGASGGNAGGVGSGGNNAGTEGTGPGGRGGRGRSGNNSQEGGGANPLENTILPAAPDKYLKPKDIKHKALPMGGQSGATAPTGDYQTYAPNYSDLSAKHQMGYDDPVSGEKAISNLFNFNGTVYRYEPDSNVYTDTYTGNVIGPAGNDTGSRGIVGLTGGYQQNAYQSPNTGEPWMQGENTGLPFVKSQQNRAKINPAYTQWQQDQRAAEQKAEELKAQQYNAHSYGDWH